MEIAEFSFLEWVASDFEKNPDKTKEDLLQFFADKANELAIESDQEKQIEKIRSLLTAEEKSDLLNLFEKKLVEWHSEIYIDQTLSSALDDARLLLDYLSRSGVELPNQVVNTLINSRSKLLDGQMHAHDEANFWMAFRQLSTVAAPVTVEKIKQFSHKDELPWYERFWKTKPIPGSYMGSSFNFSLIGYMGILLIAIIFAAWFHLYSLMVDSHVRAVEQARETFSQAKDLFDQDTAIDRSTFVANANKQLCSLKQSYDNAQLNLNNITFFDLWQNSDKITPCDTKNTIISLDGPETAIQKQVIRKDVLIGAFLPLIYGLLGAIVYVIRSMDGELREMVSSRASVRRNLLRVPLGIFAGLGIGTLFNPGTLSGLQALTPLGLAFVAGYSIDLLFAVIDRILAAFSDEDPQKKNKQEPEKENDQNQQEQN